MVVHDGEGGIVDHGREVPRSDGLRVADGVSNLLICKYAWEGHKLDISIGAEGASRVVEDGESESSVRGAEGEVDYAKLEQPEHRREAFGFHHFKMKSELVRQANTTGFWSSLLDKGNKEDLVCQGGKLLDVANLVLVKRVSQTWSVFQS